MEGDPINSPNNGDKLSVCQPFGHDHVHHGVEKHHVGTAALAEVQAGEANQGYPSRIGYNEDCPPPHHGRLNAEGNDGVRLGSV
mgnify:CR=1 FL=1